MNAKELAPEETASLYAVHQKEREMDDVEN
jgi:hypothetical protein